jgi:formamidopyrimidine-DNA glycosylase
MPELPEVETIARGLAKRVTGDVIESVWLGSKPQTFKSRPAEIAAALEGRRISEVRRMGKHIVFELEGRSQGSGVGSQSKSRSAGEGARPTQTQQNQKSGFGKAKSKAADRSVRPTSGSKSADRSVRPTQANAQWIVHLGMTGKMVVCPPDAKIEKHTHAILKLGSGNELRFVDPRRFGRLSVVTETNFDPGGIEPMAVQAENFISMFRGRNTPIKSALLNQKLLRGVGNIYADESLFRSGIRPRRRTATLTREQLNKLMAAVKGVLAEAIALGGSSVSDYVDADGEEGFFQLQHRVYGREGEPCLVCKSPVKRVVIAGRSSHYCPKCQK